jgi:hypothetical protein
MHIVFMGKLEEMSPLGRTRRRWKGNIKMDIRQRHRMVRTEFIWFRIEFGGGYRKHSEEHSCLIKL